jgi:hypothetical protein
LDALYLQLGQMAYVNMEGEKVKEEMQKEIAEKVTEMKSPKRVYQSKITDTLMDTTSTHRTFNF